VIEFAKTLVKQQRPQGISGLELLHFAGTMSGEDADAMIQAIEEECERIEPHW
jgi:hypothetical protein